MLEKYMKYVQSKWKRFVVLLVALLCHNILVTIVLEQHLLKEKVDMTLLQFSILAILVNLFLMLFLFRGWVRRRQYAFWSLFFKMLVWNIVMGIVMGILIGIITLFLTAILGYPTMKLLTYGLTLMSQNMIHLVILVGLHKQFKGKVIQCSRQMMKKEEWIIWCLLNVLLGMGGGLISFVAQAIVDTIFLYILIIWVNYHFQYEDMH